MIHGILDSVDCWVLGPIPPVRLMIEKGYDVFFLNSRGNKYSCEHATIKGDVDQFWDFSFQEMGQYDVPTVLNHIHGLTGRKVTIVAHSQGSTQTFAFLAENPKLASERVEQFHALAPVANMIGLDKNSVTYYLPVKRVFWLAETLGIQKIIAAKINDNWLSDSLIRIFCDRGDRICDFFISKLIDKSPHRVDHKQMRLILAHVPARSSIKSFRHFIQILFDDGLLRKYDYGKIENFRRYGQDKPPAYDLSKIETPVVLYVAENDLLVSGQGVDALMKSLRHARKVFYDDWGHLTFFWGTERAQFNRDLITQMEQLDKITKNG